MGLPMNGPRSRLDGVTYHDQLIESYPNSHPVLAKYPVWVIVAIGLHITSSSSIDTGLFAISMYNFSLFFYDDALISTWI